jgi:hypothetical protein
MITSVHHKHNIKHRSQVVRRIAETFNHSMLRRHRIIELRTMLKPIEVPSGKMTHNHLSVEVEALKQATTDTLVEDAAIVMAFIDLSFNPVQQ